MQRTPLVGKILAGHRLVTELGSGTMGTVYYAEHTVIGRRAAIKVLHPEVAQSEEGIARFHAEARSVNEIRHPNVAEITDLGQQDGVHYVVMEFLEGETLGARLERTKLLDERSALRIVRQVASALGAAHERGIVHRNVKPENVFLTNHPDYPDFVKVLDFGIAKLSGASGSVGHQTLAGALLGTPTYMSPEQCRGQAGLDHRSDIYSLGVVLYEMVTGRPPFVAAAVGEIIIKHAVEAPVPASELAPCLSPPVDAAISRALEKSPAARFATMQELRTALDSQAATRPFLSPSASPTLAVPDAPRTPEQERRDRREAQYVVDRLTEIIRKRIAADRLVLPAMPGTALECMQVLSDPHQTFGSVGTVLGRDPLLASRVLKLANSAAFPSRVPAESLEQAIARMGTEGLMSAIVEFSLYDAFTSRDERIQRSFRGVWEHSLAVSLLAKDLCSFGGVPGLEPQTAYLIGLLHDIGKPVVGAILLEAERQLAREGDRSLAWMSDAVWKQVVNDSHRSVGVALARKWMLPDTVVRSIEQSRAYVRALPRSSANVVCLANALAKKYRVYLGEIDDAEVDALIDEGRALLGLQDAVVARLCEGLVGRVQSLIPTSMVPGGAASLAPASTRRPTARARP
jgi:putative nucleotidyltransferase with HDIG domain